jgi:hypothetical protein
MEAKLFASLYRLVFAVAHPPRRKREQFCDRWILLVFLWSALHDRPRAWACDEANWPAKTLDGRPLPSPSRLSRRLRTVGVLQLLERVLGVASDTFGVPPLVKDVDSKPMTVGAHSQDRDALRGRVAQGQLARGYRLHAVTHGRVVRHWTLASMNTHDSKVAPLLFAKLEGGGYVNGDNAYDTNDCHAAAAAANHQLVAPPRKSNKGVRDPEHNRPERMRALDMLDTPLRACGLRGAFGSALYDCRQRIESCFGGLSMSGLDHLPTWVRGPRRVALWAGGKILASLVVTARKQGLRIMTQ